MTLLEHFINVTISLSDLQTSLNYISYSDNSFPPRHCELNDKYCKHSLKFGSSVNVCNLDTKHELERSVIFLF